jgi:FKBP-type peptidyl-prolyl cis-trans isomerase
MNVTGTSIAVALAVAVTFGFFAFGSPFAPLGADSEVTMQTEQTASTTVTTSPPMDIPAELPKELTITDVVIGTGAEAKPGTTVAVNYVGMLPDGTVFDASANRGEPIVFELGAGRVIRGWDEGLVGMKVGGKRQLIIPADMAYGNQAVGDIIPANATLLFEVELVGVQ